MTLDRSRNNDSITCKMEGCNKPANHDGDIREIGVNKGNGTTLANNILRVKYEGIANSVADHALSTTITLKDKTKRWLMEYNAVQAGRKELERLSTNPDNLSPEDLEEARKKCKTKYVKNFSRVAAAHHLICSASMNNDDWKDICETFGYDINSWENGVFLPQSFYIACDIAIPAHRGNHEMKQPAFGNIKYVDLVDEELNTIKADAMKKEYCAEHGSEKLIEDLNSYSEDLWVDILDIKLLLTTDGLNYKSDGPGCRSADWKPLQEASTFNCRTNVFRSVFGHGYMYLRGLGGEHYFLERDYYAHTDEEFEFEGGDFGGGGASGGY